MASHPIYQFYAELDDYAPKIWRRFQVLGNVTMARLGYIVMTLYEMKASHLFAIEMPREWELSCFEIPDDESEDLYDEDIADREADAWDPARRVSHDATEVKLSHVTRERGGKFNFLYDFGDGWQVTLRLESVTEDAALPGKELPRVLEGAGYGIIEDCGGVPGLAELAKAFRAKSGAAYDGYRKWLGVEDLNLEAFDMADMNFRLKKVPRIYADLYEHDLEPTRQSIHLLERKYLGPKAPGGGEGTP